MEQWCQMIPASKFVHNVLLALEARLEYYWMGYHKKGSLLVIWNQLELKNRSWDAHPVAGDIARFPAHISCIAWNHQHHESQWDPWSVFFKWTPKNEPLCLGNHVDTAFHMFHCHVYFGKVPQKANVTKHPIWTRTTNHMIGWQSASSQPLL